ncbi:hypothetical protein CsatA_018371 [Cannabis sativa]
MSSLLLFSHQREKFALIFGVKFLCRGHVLVISSTDDIFISFYFSASLSSPNSHNLKSHFRPENSRQITQNWRSSTSLPDVFFVLRRLSHLRRLGPQSYRVGLLISIYN